MLSIEPNKQWEQMSKLMKDILVRYDWFLFEFSKQFTRKVNKYLVENIKRVKGPRDYAKRLVMAEFRTRNQVWFALTVKSVPLNQSSKSVSSSLIYVYPKISIQGQDPIRDILEAGNPWTIDTIPFAPSSRQATVEIKQVSQKMYDSVNRNNMNRITDIAEKMKSMGMEFETRSHIISTLKVVEDLESVVNDMEFKLGKKHWGPAIRKAKVVGLRALMSDRILLASLTDANWTKHRVKKHLRVKIREKDIKEFESFQKKINRTMANA